MSVYVALFLLVCTFWIREGFSRAGSFRAHEYGSNEKPTCRSPCIQESSVTAYDP